MAKPICKGDAFYNAWIYVEETYGNESTHIEMEEWIVTSNTQKGVYLKRKNSLTFKNGDWVQFDSYMRTYCIKSFENEQELLKTLHKTKASAYRSILPQAKRIKRQISTIVTKIEKQLATKQNSNKIAKK